MRVAIVAPTPYLAAFAGYRGNRYHLALAQRVCTDPAYAGYYAEEAERGSSVTLDNGACELGASIADDLLLQAADRIRPTRIVLPDVIGDAAQTITRTRAFLHSYGSVLHPRQGFMAVVQGRTREEWLACLDAWAREQAVTVIGVSDASALIDVPAPHARVELIRELWESGRIRRDQGVHLLGMGDSAHLECAHASQLECIEGCDTSAPVTHGARGVEFAPGVPYRKVITQEEGPFTDEQIRRIERNLAALFDAIT